MNPYPICPEERGAFDEWEWAAMQAEKQHEKKENDDDEDQED